MLKIQNITKEFNASRVVDDVSLQVKKGEFCVLIGSSGSGKSTTLRMINRLIEPTKGNIYINGEDIKAVPKNELRRKIGYAIQGIGLFPHQDVFENIATVPKLLKWSRVDIESRVKELLELFHLDFATFAHKLPHQLSGGQQQRVGVARALAARPELLLMDEPFGALDAITRAYLQDELLQIQKKLKITILMVTHDIEEAIKLGDNIAVMDGGKLLQMASATELMKNPNDGFVKKLVGGDDRALSLLSLTKVGEVMAPNLEASKSLEVDKNEANHLQIGDTLREALSKLVWLGESSLFVTDEHQKIVGIITLDDIMAKGKNQ